jgi:hypothetical protein
MPYAGRDKRSVSFFPRTYSVLSLCPSVPANYTYFSPSRPGWHADFAAITSIPLGRLRVFLSWWPSGARLLVCAVNRPVILELAPCQ